MSYVSKWRASVRLTYCSMLAPLKQIACNCTFGPQCSKGPSVCFCLRWQVYPYTAITSYRLCKSMPPTHTHTQLNANAVLMKWSTVCVSMQVCLLACIFHALFSVYSKTRGPPMWNWASLQRHKRNVLLALMFLFPIKRYRHKDQKGVLSEKSFLHGWSVLSFWTEGWFGKGKTYFNNLQRIHTQF